jgi:hypothetical protein
MPNKIIFYNPYKKLSAAPVMCYNSTQTIVENKIRQFQKST